MGETNVELEILAHVRTTIENLLIVGRPCALQLPRISLFFLAFFLLYVRIGNLEPSFKFQRASRPKEEDRRGLDKLSRRGAAANGFSFFGSCLDPKDGKSFVTTLSLCSF